MTRGRVLRPHEADGRRWARAREDADLEQATAAEKLGIHPVTLSRYERGERPIPDAVRAEMTTLYRVDAGEVPDLARVSDHPLLYWSGRVDQMVDHLRQVLDEQQRVARLMRIAATGRSDPPSLPPGLTPPSVPEIKLGSLPDAPPDQTAGDAGGVERQAHG